MIILPKATWEELSSAAKRAANYTLEEVVALLDEPITQPLLLVLRVAYQRFRNDLSLHPKFRDWFIKHSPYFMASNADSKTDEYLRQLYFLCSKRDTNGARRLWDEVPAESAMFIYRNPSFRKLLA